MRLFVAIALPDEARAALAHLARVPQTADRKAAIPGVMPEMRARLERRSLFG